MTDGKSQAWRDAADKLLESLARENKYIVGDMLVIFLESADYGLDSYEPLGALFKRAAKKGIISKIERPGKQALWHSKIYSIADNKPLSVGSQITLKGFGNYSDGLYEIIGNSPDGSLKLEKASNE